MQNLALVVATIKDTDESRETDQMKILIAERHRLKLNRSILELPSALAEKHPRKESMDEAAKRALDEIGYEAEKLVYLSEGAIQPEENDQITSFFLAINAKKKEGQQPPYIVHRIPIIHIGPWVYKTGLMVAPTVWAGIYLRISHLLSNPMHGSIQ
jgi:hypothetical protein